MVIFSQNLVCVGLGARYGKGVDSFIVTPTHLPEECVLNSPTALGSAGLEVLFQGDVKNGMVLQGHTAGFATKPTAMIAAWTYCSPATKRQIGKPRVTILEQGGR